MIDYSRVSIFYITIDSGYDGLHSLKEVKSSDAIQHEWYDVRAGLSMFPYIILVDTNRTVVSRFPDIENNIYAFKQTDLYTNYYKNHPDEDWPENELFMDQDNLKKTKPYVYNFYINNYGYLMAWEAFFESKCDTQYRTYVERILDFIENNKICIEIQDVANKYYNKTLKD
ncbi:MAG: hypothetical protein NTY22_06980 [Proteobacteria bacterium]|nr:hypothetical protein [Pseudomonadota bacterium]